MHLPMKSIAAAIKSLKMIFFFFFLGFTLVFFDDCSSDPELQFKLLYLRTFTKLFDSLVSVIVIVVIVVVIATKGIQIVHP